MYLRNRSVVDRLLRSLDSLPEVGYTVLRTEAKYDVAFNYVKIVLEESVIGETMEDFSEHISQALRLLGVPIANWQRISDASRGYRWMIEDPIDGSYFELYQDDGIVISVGTKRFISTQEWNVHSNQFLRAYRRILKPE